MIYGSGRNTLHWFRSYLTNWIQICKIGQTKSHVIKFGTPQGSNIRPLLFLIYIKRPTKLSLTKGQRSKRWTLLCIRIGSTPTFYISICISTLPRRLSSATPSVFVDNANLTSGRSVEDIQDYLNTDLETEVWIILDSMRKPNPIIVLLYIQNSQK